MKIFSSKEKRHSPVRTQAGYRQAAYSPDLTRQVGVIRQILGRPQIQGKLTVSAPNDALEQEEPPMLAHSGFVERMNAHCAGRPGRLVL